MVSASWKKMPLSACHPTAETSQHHTCYRFQDATDRHPQHHVLHDFRHIGQTRLIHRVPEFKGLYPLSCFDKKASVPFNQVPTFRFPSQWSRSAVPCDGDVWNFRRVELWLRWLVRSTLDELSHPCVLIRLLVHIWHSFQCNWGFDVWPQDQVYMRL